MGNVENAKAWFHMHGAEVEGQRGVAQINFSAEGIDLCCRHRTLAAEKGRG